MSKRKKTTTKRHGGALTKMRSGMRSVTGTQKRGRRKQPMNFMQVMGGVMAVVAVLMMVWAMR
jgi:crotonobetainyl-CoA:carnitine CoA-transferase CaiB-like acyl-CoA transferase